MTGIYRRTQVVSVVVLAWVALLSPAIHTYNPAAIPNAPEPTRAEVLKKARIDPRDSVALWKHLSRLLSKERGCIDVWIPTLRLDEHHQLEVAATALGYGNRGIPQRWLVELPKLEAALQARRPLHPARLADAILRQLEEVGTPDQLGELLSAATVQGTGWGRWKFYATVQGILARHPAAEVAKRQRLTPVLAALLRDLPPRKRGEVAAALLERERNEPGDGPGRRALPPRGSTALWLAWSLSSTDPEAALPLFQPGLESSDPALRLFAGLGIARISDARIPYRLTADRRTTEADRTAWLKGLKLRRADDWRFADPLERPVLQVNRGSRVDLWWLAMDASIARKQEDVWPGVLQVLPDGTYYAGLSERTQSAALTGLDGAVLVRFPEGRYELQHATPEAHGGFWALRDQGSRAAEYSVTGERLWECPLVDDLADGRFIAGAGPGRVLLVRYGVVEILNRRGDVIWFVGNRHDHLTDWDKKPPIPLGDPRWACAVDPDTVLIACQTTVELHHRTKGRLLRVSGFTSVGAVRYHPEKPWMIFDGGASSVVLHDLRKGSTVARRLGWTNDDPSRYSKWLPANVRFPED